MITVSRSQPSKTESNHYSREDNLSSVNQLAMNNCTDHGDHLQPEGATGRQQQDEEKVPGGPRFYPPLYCQRYTLVQNVLQEHQVESVWQGGELVVHLILHDRLLFYVAVSVKVSLFFFFVVAM